MSTADGVKVYKDCKPGETSYGDDCFRTGAGKDCGIKGGGPGLAPATTYCCDVKNGRCDCNTELVNPCSDPENCLRCLIGAEARGHTGTNNACAKAIACAVKTRRDHPDYPNDICGVIDEGYGGQFSPLHCICADWRPDGQGGGSGYKNDFYCRCCSGDLTPEEQQQVDNAMQGVDLNNLDCSGLEITHYVPDSPGSSCKRVQVPGCNSERFWYCPPRTRYIEKVARALSDLTDTVEGTAELKEALDEVERKMKVLAQP